MSSPTTVHHLKAHSDEVLVRVPPDWSWTLTAPNGFTVTGRPLTPQSRTESDDPDRRVWFDDGISVPITFGTGPALPWDILAVSINSDPGSATSRTASIQLVNDHWVKDLGPAALTDLATKAHVLLDALTHAAQSTADSNKVEFSGIHVPITSDVQPTREREILASTLYYIQATSTEPPKPTISIHIIDDAWITNLTPAALTDFTTKARAYFDMLTHALRPALTRMDKIMSPSA